MEELPEEIIAKIFNYLNDPITASQVCLYFNQIATTRIRSIDIKVTSEKSERIKFLRESLHDFQSLKKLKLDLSFDVNNAEKSKFCYQFSDKLTQLVLREMTFLNPFFSRPKVTFSSLTALTIENSDLCSCSVEISNFILRCCPELKDLTISGCSGLEIDSLNNIGQNLHHTQIENFQLLPTYSYFDVASTENHWMIDNLKTLSIRSKLVVMKKNFVKNVIGRRSEKLRALELIAEIDLAEPLAARITSNYPNLEKISLGKGCSMIKNEDFSSLCNFYKKLKSFEFHFSQSDEPVNLTNLRRNDSIGELTLGLTKNVTLSDVALIANRLTRITQLKIVLYYFSTSNQEFLTLITKIFPQVQHLEFQRTGMIENLKFTAIKGEIDAPNLRHFDDIRNLTN